MRLWKKRSGTKSYDPAAVKPVLKCSICTGEQVAGFQDLRTGRIDEVMLIRGERDLQQFLSEYGIKGEVEKVY